MFVDVIPFFSHRSLAKAARWQRHACLLPRRVEDMHALVFWHAAKINTVSEVEPDTFTHPDSKQWTTQSKANLIINT